MLRVWFYAGSGDQSKIPLFTNAGSSMAFLLGEWKDIAVRYGVMGAVGDFDFTAETRD